MENKKYFAYLKFKASKTNFSYENYFRNYIFKISCDKIEIITVFTSDNKHEVLRNFSDSLAELEKHDGLGHLLDIICVSTEIITSHQPDGDGYIFHSNKELLKEFYRRQNSFDTIYGKIRSQKRYNTGYIGNDWPVVIKDNETTTFTPEKLSLGKQTLDYLLQYSKYTEAHITLLNYWRKGYVLNELWFWDESYLNYYKIIEYFLNKYRSKTKLITRLLNAISNRKSNTSLNDAKSLLNKLHLNSTNENAELILILQMIRNKLDIAHNRIKRKNGNNALTYRESFYSFSYYMDYWNYWDNAEELSRLLLLRSLEYYDVGLYPDGGLLKLKLKQDIDLK